MTETVAVTSRSARAERMLALSPRIALYVAIAILSVGGVRAMLQGEDPPPMPQRVVMSADVGAQAFAEGFARAYLTYDSARPQDRERALAAYLSGGLEPDGGYAPSRDSRTVLWTATTADSVRGRQHTVTVAAETSDGLIHLAVPVARTDRRFLHVTGYPALVGPPAVEKGARAESEEEVEDSALRAVAERAVRNYLARERRDLLADLAPDAVVSLPATPLALRSVQEITWAKPRTTVAVLVEAEDGDRSQMTLRYELGVSRRDRWYVRSLHVDPRQGGVSR